MSYYRRPTMSGYCDGCDCWAQRLIRKGGLWFCERCLGCEL